MDGLKTSSGSGSGYGYGYGYGSGYGSGSGYGYGSGDGYGSGSGSGYGYGYGSGDGSGDGYGYGSGDGYAIAKCGDHETRWILPWGLLRVGCEIHTLDYWIDNADEIDLRHGDGIADQTRALAIRLKGGSDA